MATPLTDREGITQVMHALERAGWQSVGVQQYGDDREPVASTQEAIEQAIDVEDAFVIVDNGERESWVRFVLGNAPDEVVNDYLTSLSPVLDPLTESWF